MALGVICIGEDMTNNKGDIIPSTDLQFFLFVIDSLRLVQGKVNLLKIHYLVESEAHLYFINPNKTYRLGPADYLSFNYSIQNDLIDQTQELNVWGTRYIYSLTQKGINFFNNKCKPLMKKNEKKKAQTIIDKYYLKTGTELMIYIHKKYVDKFKDKQITLTYIKQLQENIPIYQDLILKANIHNIIEEDNQNTLVEAFYHIEDILDALKKSKNATECGTIITIIKEILTNLELNQYKSDPYTCELVDFLDNYADKQKICKSIYSDDLSDIPDEVRKRLFKAMKQVV